MPDDDYREISNLLFRTEDRYRTARATIEHRRQGMLATEAINRYVEYGFSHGILSNFDPPYHVPRYREYGDLEENTRLWHERPDRWRQETESSDQPGITYRVANGQGPWWFYQPPDWADYSPANPNGEFSPDEEFACLLDPFRVRYGFECTLKIVGEAYVTGRNTVEVEAKAISWDYAPHGPFWDGADDYLMSVDAEIGVILRFASRLRGAECDSFEITELVFDETFPEDTFVLDLPGIDFERIDPLP